jgi:GntR family transcriptional regulator
MLIVVDPSSGVPVFRQVMDQVRFQVASGVLRPGDELPPTRSLSAELGVNPMTVSKAYNLLEREGVLQRRPGRPLVVRALTGAEMQARREDLLREQLVEAARMVAQLGLDHDEVVELWREVLTDTSPPSTFADEESQT